MDTPLLVLLIILAVIAVGLLAVAIVLVVKLLRLYGAVKSRDMPVSGKVAFWGALIYGIFPVDLLPDPIYLDDVAILAGAVAYVGNLARTHGLGRGQPRPSLGQPELTAPPRIGDELPSRTGAGSPPERPAAR